MVSRFLEIIGSNLALSSVVPDTPVYGGLRYASFRIIWYQIVIARLNQLAPSRNSSTRNTDRDRAMRARTGTVDGANAQVVRTECHRPQHAIKGYKCKVSSVVEPE